MWKYYSVFTCYAPTPNQTANITVSGLVYSGHAEHGTHSQDSSLTAIQLQLIERQFIEGTWSQPMVLHDVLQRYHLESGRWFNMLNVNNQKKTSQLLIFRWCFWPSPWFLIGLKIIVAECVVSACLNWEADAKRTALITHMVKLLRWNITISSWVLLMTGWAPMWKGQRNMAAPYPRCFDLIFKVSGDMTHPSRWMHLLVTALL